MKWLQDVRLAIGLLLVYKTLYCLQGLYHVNNYCHVDNVLYTTDMLPEDSIVEPKRVLKATIKNFNGVTIQGAKGDTGEKGDKGDTGEKGATGAKGDKGKDGKDGRNGIDGLNGVDGRDGVDGKDGKDGSNGKDGSPDSAEQVRDKLSSLKGEERLDARNIKNLPQGRVGGVLGIKEIVAGTNITVDNSTLGYPVISSTGGGGSGFGIIAVPGQPDLEPAGAGDTLTIVAGTNVTITTDSGLNELTINSVEQNTIGGVAVSGQDTVTPDAPGDTFVFTEGTNMTITTNNITKEIVFNSTATGGVNEDSFGIVVDGAGTAITTGSKGTKYIPWDCTVTGWDIRSDISGSCVFDIKRSGVSLAGTEKPTLSAASSNSDLTLSTWTTSLTAGDVVEFVVDSASTLTRATVTILVSKI